MKKEISLLALPAVVVVGLSIFLIAPRGGGNLASTDAKVIPVSGQPYDTQVDVVVKYNKPFAFPESMRASYGCKSWRVVDARGKPLKFKIERMSMDDIGNYR